MNAAEIAEWAGDRVLKMKKWMSCWYAEKLMLEESLTGILFSPGETGSGLQLICAHGSVDCAARAGTSLEETDICINIGFCLLMHSRDWPVREMKLVCDWSTRVSTSWSTCNIQIRGKDGTASHLAQTRPSGNYSNKMYGAPLLAALSCSVGFVVCTESNGGIDPVHVPMDIMRALPVDVRVSFFNFLPSESSLQVGSDANMGVWAARYGQYDELARYLEDGVV